MVNQLPIDSSTQIWQNSLDVASARGGGGDEGCQKTLLQVPDGLKIVDAHGKCHLWRGITNKSTREATKRERDSDAVCVSEKESVCSREMKKQTNK